MGVFFLFAGIKKKRSLLISVVLILYFIYSAFVNVQPYITDKPELYIFCGKDGGKVLLCHKETNIYIDLSTSDKINTREFINSKCRDRLTLAVFGTAKNMNNAVEDGILAEAVYYHKSVENSMKFMEFEGSFNSQTAINDKISIKCGDINLTLKAGKSYNIAEAEINYKNRTVVITNDLNSVKSENSEYIISHNLINAFENYNVLNCDKQEIERIRL